MQETLPQSIATTSSLQRKKRSFWRQAKKELPFAIGCIPFVWQIFFFYIPLIYLIGSGFTVASSNRLGLSLTLEHFRPLFNSTYLSVILNSLFLSGCTTFCSLILGFTIAYTIVFHGGRLKSLFLFLLLIPFWTNFILHIYAWFFVLEKHGFLNTLLLNMHLIKEPLHFLNSYSATLLMMIYFYLPFMVLPIYSSLERFDSSLLEASLDLGANKWKTIRCILLPLNMSSIRAGIYLVFIPAFGEFVIPEIMGGDKDFFIGSVVSLFILGEKTVPLGIAFTCLAVIVLLISLFFIQMLLSKATDYLIGEWYA